MGREWKPGDVALIAYGSGEFTDVAVRTDPAGWAVAAGDVRDRSVIEARPLVVIDPEDREQVERLAQAYFADFWSRPEAGTTISATFVEGDRTKPLDMHVDSLLSALREFAGPPTSCLRGSDE